MSGIKPGSWASDIAFCGVRGYNSHMVRYSVESLGDGTFRATCDAYSYLEAVEDSFPMALESIQDLVEREIDESSTSYDWSR